MKRRLTKLTAAGLAVLALTGCTGGVPEEVSEEPPVPKNVETTWTLVVGQPEGSTCWDAAGYQTVQTDVTIFPAFYEPAILTMNSDLYDSLSPDLREAVDRCGREAMADQRLRNREQEAEILERWQEEDGISVHVLTEEQWSAFQALTDRLYDPEDPDHQDWFADCTPEWVEQFRPS